jgi:hypothetical protein
MCLFLEQHGVACLLMSGVVGWGKDREGKGGRGLGVF